MKFHEGDRVRVKPNAAKDYLQPWRGRFESGREGTVVNVSGYMVNVRWDSARRPKHPHDWLLRMATGDLELVGEADNG